MFADSGGGPCPREPDGHDVTANGDRTHLVRIARRGAK
jgi:hypothetical protein